MLTLSVWLLAMFHNGFELWKILWCTSSSITGYILLCRISDLLTFKFLARSVNPNVNLAPDANRHLNRLLQRTSSQTCYASKHVSEFRFTQNRSGAIVIMTMSALFPQWWEQSEAMMGILSAVSVSYVCQLKCKTTWHWNLSPEPMTSQWTMLDIKTSADYLSRTGTFTNFSMLFAGKYATWLMFPVVLK